MLTWVYIFRCLLVSFGSVLLIPSLVQASSSSCVQGMKAELKKRFLMHTEVLPWVYVPAPKIAVLVERSKIKLTCFIKENILAREQHIHYDFPVLFSVYFAFHSHSTCCRIMKWNYWQLSRLYIMCFTVIKVRVCWHTISWIAQGCFACRDTRMLHWRLHSRDAWAE